MANPPVASSVFVVMSRKSKRNQRGRVRRRAGMAANGVIGDFVRKIPGIGPVAGPLIGGAEDLIVKINRNNKSTSKSGPISKNGRMGAANVGMS